MTNETMPRHIWMHHVFIDSNVSNEDAQPFRDMLNRWYNAGEPVSMAAHSLKIAVKERNRAIRIETQAQKDNLGKIFRSSLNG